MIFTPDSVDREEPVYLTDNLSTSYQRYVCVCLFVHDCYIVTIRRAVPVQM